MDAADQIQELFSKPEWTDQECQLILNYLNSNNYSALNELLKDRFTADLNTTSPTQKETADRILALIHSQIKEQKPALVFTLKRVWWAAASVIVLATGSYFLFFNKEKPAIQTQAVRYKNDVKPGGNKAILTLGNGTTIILDSAQKGSLAKQGSTSIFKTDSGKLAYEAGNEKSKDVVYNILSTPKGGQYQLQLPDGSEVWLNAASSITYPTAFTGTERKVEITGEAYFEVIKNPKMPFTVIANEKTIQVLGTHFDVNAYPDETITTTTLLEGSVKFNKLMLKPGEQGTINNASGQAQVKNNIDIEEVMAWKNGKFIFSGNNIASVMRQLSRWYNVDVEYKGDITKEEFVGDIARTNNLSAILSMLEKTHILQFEVEGKRVTVEPYLKK